MASARLTTPAAESAARDPERRALVERLLPLFRDPFAPRDPAELAALELAVFRRQYDRCAPFRRLCEAAGVGRDADDPDAIPAVPTEAFKEMRIACFDPTEGEIVFRTSGTSEGRPGLHAMPTTELYDAAAMPWLAAHLLPDLGKPGAPARGISLTASPENAPASSLVHMIATAGRTFALPIEYAPDPAEARRALRGAAAAGEPTIVFATAFSLVALLDALDAGGETIALPPGSRVMETGGYKGRSRRVEKNRLYEWTEAALGVPARAIVNEYGMTEMSSQFHDSTLRDPDGPDSRVPPDARAKTPPPWVRSTAVDPTTLAPVAPGEVGVLRHVDLANLDSCAFLQTADAARALGGGRFALLGRMDEAPPRGCSLDYEDAIDRS